MHMRQVVEGFFEPNSHEMVSSTASMAYLPNGTGGDFRKSLGYVTEVVGCGNQLLW